MSNFVKLNISLLNSPQMLTLQQAEGLEGWGVVLLLFKHLVESQNHCVCSLRSLPGLARQCGKRLPTIERILTRYGLFVIDRQRGIFYSPYLLRSMKSSLGQALRNIDDETAGHPSHDESTPYATQKDTSRHPKGHPSPSATPQERPSETATETSPKAQRKHPETTAETPPKSSRYGLSEPTSALQPIDNQHSCPTEKEREEEREREKEKDGEKDEEKERPTPRSGAAADASPCSTAASPGPDDVSAYPHDASPKDKRHPAGTIPTASTTAAAAAPKNKARPAGSAPTASTTAATASEDTLSPAEKRQWELIRQIYYDHPFLQGLEQLSDLSVHTNRNLCRDSLYWFYFQCQAKGKQLADINDAKRYLTALLTRGRKTRDDFMRWLNRKREKEFLSQSPGR